MTLPDPVEEAKEFDSGWDSPEFKAGDDPPVKTDDDPPTQTAKADDDPPAETDDDPPAQTAKADDDPPAETDDDPPAKAATNYVPSYKDVVEELKKTEQRIETMISTPPASPKPKNNDEPIRKRVDLSEFTGDKLKARLEKVRDVAPEAAEAFEPIIGGLAGALEQSYKEVDTLRATTVQDKAEQAAVAVETQIDSKHKDWKQTVSSQEFKGWLNEQPKYVQRVAQTTDDPEEFVGILDQYADSKASDPTTETDDDPPTETDDDPPADADADEEARRVALDAAKQPEPKARSQRQPPSGKRVLSAEEEFEAGWKDPEFNPARQSVTH